ncbi:fumarylacetoacetate hydrolase family protein [Paenibacillus sp. N1-5-1-14]|uniref:fumarylacetoacetate hydrolase family protein n=1 Tax=Paenibacillus radicibacter TaxID=2972488 RepID=UPI002158C7C3|nr:fumarylacetoacetate hydrolase family protein [Paenibacillus radicibacter]MCR8644030.1 fumarylacetoacetate hydrolase family protein [Paenibacillus radicibacter]
MKFLNFQNNNELALGVKVDAGIVDLAKASELTGQVIALDIHEVMENGQCAVSRIHDVVESVLADATLREACVLDEETITYGPCVTRPNKIICVGLNYRKHAEETNAPIPEYPILFNKFNNTISAPNQDIPLPKVSTKVDYEAELVIVIGKTAKYVAQEDALSHVFGYCNVNDLSARDLQLRTHQWLLGKSCDGFSPLGPYLVTADEVGNPNDLTISCTVNGEVRQSSNTSDMIFHCDYIVSYISQHMTLVPGDIILTGTPEGVVLGLPPEKQVYLQDGDMVTIEIEKLGSLTNRMVKE